MPQGHMRWQRGSDGNHEAVAYAAGSEPRIGTIGPVEIAEAPPAPVDVPRPKAGETISVTVQAGHPLKLGFFVDDVHSREVVRDDLVLGLDNGGKVVLKDYMQAFGLLGEYRTTIIQPDGKHYAFTEMLAPTSGHHAGHAPSAGSDVVIVHKPAAGETEHVKLAVDKPIALDFGLNTVAQSHLDKAGNLVLTFRDHGVLVLEGYAALKNSPDVSVYFAKGDKIPLAALAPGAGPEAGAEGGHLFSAFEGGTLGQGLEHLGPLAALPFALIPPPGPPGSPPGTPPETPPGTPPIVCKPPDHCVPPPDHCLPPPDHHHHHHPHVRHHTPPPCEPRIVVCDVKPRHDGIVAKHHGEHGKPHDHHGHHDHLTWVKAAGCVVAGDVHQGDRHGGAAEHPAGRNWADGHDGGAAPAPHHHDHHHEFAALAAAPAHHADASRHDGDAQHGVGHGHHAAFLHGPARHDTALHGPALHGPALHGPALHDTARHDTAPGAGGLPRAHGHGKGIGADHGVADGHAALAPAHLFDHGAGDHAGAASKQAGDHAAAFVHFAAAHDFAAVAAHAESAALHIQNHAHHNVMGH